MTTMTDLCPGGVKLNVAEFIAMLITSETFTPFFANKLLPWRWTMSPQEHGSIEEDVPVSLSTAVSRVYTFGW